MNDSVNGDSSQPELRSKKSRSSRRRKNKKEIDVNCCSGLRHVTYQVLLKLETMRDTTYEEVAHELAQQFVYGPNGSHNIKDDKNMRRRAYDVMNVLAAVGYLRKTGKKLKFVGEATQQRLDQLICERDERLARVEAKRNELQFITKDMAFAEVVVSDNVEGDSDRGEEETCSPPIKSEPFDWSELMAEVVTSDLVIDMNPRPTGDAADNVNSDLESLEEYLATSQNSDVPSEVQLLYLQPSSNAAEHSPVVVAPAYEGYDASFFELAYASVK